jgi:hypothetical protein
MPAKGTTAVIAFDKYRQAQLAAANTAFLDSLSDQSNAWTTWASGQVVKSGTIAAEAKTYLGSVDITLKLDAVYQAYQAAMSQPIQISDAWSEQQRKLSVLAAELEPLDSLDYVGSVAAQWEKVNSDFAKIESDLLRTNALSLPVVYPRSAPSMSAPVEKPVVAREYPDSMYVDVPTITKTTGGAVLLVCMLSITIYILTGFAVVQTMFSFLGILFGLGFYLMGRVLERQYHPDR